jgi:hypothetical protein
MNYKILPCHYRLLVDLFVLLVLTACASLSNPAERQTLAAQVANLGGLNPVQIHTDLPVRAYARVAATSSGKL